MKKCTFCGVQQSDTTKYCTQCGKFIADKPPVPIQENKTCSMDETSDSDAMKLGGRRKNRGMIIAAMLTAAAALGVSGYFVFHNTGHHLGGNALEQAKTAIRSGNFSEAYRILDRLSGSEADRPEVFQLYIDLYQELRDQKGLDVLETDIRRSSLVPEEQKHLLEEIEEARSDISLNESISLLYENTRKLRDFFLQADPITTTLQEVVYEASSLNLPNDSQLNDRTVVYFQNGRTVTRNQIAPDEELMVYYPQQERVHLFEAPGETLKEGRVFSYLPFSDPDEYYLKYGTLIEGIYDGAFRFVDVIEKDDYLAWVSVNADQGLYDGKGSMRVENSEAVYPWQEVEFRQGKLDGTNRKATDSEGNEWIYLVTNDDYFLSADPDEIYRAEFTSY